MQAHFKRKLKVPNESLTPSSKSTTGVDKNCLWAAFPAENKLSIQTSIVNCYLAWALDKGSPNHVLPFSDIGKPLVNTTSSQLHLEECILHGGLLLQCRKCWIGEVNRAERGKTERERKGRKGNALHPVGKLLSWLLFDCDGRRSGVKWNNKKS